jgi:acyl-coenzyme A thioesterase PaaI-like protein
MAGIPKQEFIRLVEQGTALMRATCMPQVEAMAKGEMSACLHHRKELCTDEGFKYIHNTVVSSTMDNIAGFCAWSTLDSYHRVSTVDLNVTYLHSKPIPFQLLRLDAAVFSKTENLILVNVKCFDSERKILFATCQATFNVYHGKIPFGSVSDTFSGAPQEVR